VDLSSVLRHDSNPLKEISIRVLDNSEEGRLRVEVGPEVGASVWLLLENAYGKTRFKFAYSGKQEITGNCTRLGGRQAYDWGCVKELKFSSAESTLLRAGFNLRILELR
jgi:hypothetical protein